MKRYLTPKLLAVEKIFQIKKNFYLESCRRRFFLDTILNFIQPVGRASSLSCAHGQDEIVQINLLRSLRQQRWFLKTRDRRCRGTFKGVFDTSTMF